jgi:hypothetical protein
MTPGGKPQKGDVFRIPMDMQNKTSVEEFVVIRRTGGDVSYSCQVHWTTGPKQGRRELLTEFDYWMPQYIYLGRIK